MINKLRKCCGINFIIIDDNITKMSSDYLFLMVKSSKRCLAMTLIIIGVKAV